MPRSTQPNKSIFKAYDIRGIYGDELDEEFACNLGKALAQYLKPKSIVVGRDGRTSSPALADSVIKGLTISGVDVINIGQVSTDMYYFACASKSLPGVMVTASHNPKEYNGFKMVKQIPYLLSGDEGIKQLKAIIEDDDYLEAPGAPGQTSDWSPMSGFIEKILSLTDVSEIRPMKIIADTANGMVGPSLVELFKKIPQVKLTPMYFEVDGGFPNHGGDPLDPANRHELQQRVQKEGYDLGFAFDPDGDRFFCIDRKGRFVSGDIMTAILSRYFLSKQPGSTIIYDIRASLAVKDTIEDFGGNPLYNRVGHAFIKKRMKDEGAVFAGEVTGHYYFRDFFGCDSGVAPMIYLLNLLSTSDVTLEEMVDDYENKYFISGEINQQVEDVAGAIKNVKKRYKTTAKNIIEIDGITIEYDDWRFNLRGSNTEPLLRLNLEAKNKKLMEEKINELLEYIKK